MMNRPQSDPPSDDPPDRHSAPGADDGRARQSDDHRYTEDDLLLGQDLADRAALVIENARAYEAEHRARTEAEQAAQSLRRSEERLHLALAAAAMGTWDWEPKSGQLTWAREVEALYGLAPGAFDGTYETYLGLIHPDDRAPHTARIARAIESGSDYESEHRVVWPDGTIHWVAGRGRAYRAADGSLERMAGTVMDVTAHKQAEQQRDELLAREQAARAEAEAAVHARDQFLSIASHELRTPVTTIKAAAQLLLRSESHGRLQPEQLRDLLGRIDRTTDHLGRLIGDLLDVSRLQTGQLPLHPTAFELDPFVHEIAARFGDQLDEQHRLVIEISPEACPVEADAGRLEQVLWNLLDNAAKYSPAGGEVRVVVGQRDSGALVEVRDHGIGLTPGAEEAIFEPFGRAPNAAARQLPGLGLGLYICRMILERHGGRIWAASAGDGQGTTISFWLPCARQAESLTPPL